MRVPRWVPPAALLLGSVGCGVGAILQEAAVADAAPGQDATRVVTPVLSVRRLPAVVAEPVADRRLRRDLEAWAAATPPGSCAVIVADDGHVVLDHRGTDPLVPASTLKLLTATAVLEELGPQHRFRTAVVGPLPVDGTVSGDVTLVGGGDPLLASPDYAARFRRQPQIFTDLDALAARVVDAGVRRISGSVRGDERRYDAQRTVAGWPDRYVRQHQVGPLSALSVNDGFTEYPTATESRALVPAPDPAAQAAGVLTRLLEARGVDVVGTPGAGAAPDGVPELAAVESEPVERVLAQLLQESDNTTAEMLLKELGRSALDPSTQGGLARERAVLDRAGLDLEGAALADGSGLSPDNRVTCGLLADVLRRPGTGAVLRRALPVAGTSGTLETAFVGTPLAGHLAAKTGSLNTVAGLAGVVEDEDGAVTFAYLVNVPAGERIDPSAVAASQQQLGEALLAWPRVPDLDALGPLPAQEER
jgi:D-alanyl-D-alanine carboxypeptidase/D-alanyl-D-alanine-endopeptidase (penicillin-binding protein 4)